MGIEFTILAIAQPYNIYRAPTSTELQNYKLTYRIHKALREVKQSLRYRISVLYKRQTQLAVNLARLN